MFSLIIINARSLFQTQPAGAHVIDITWNQKKAFLAQIQPVNNNIMSFSIDALLKRAVQYSLTVMCVMFAQFPIGDSQWRE